ncbi:MAG TPA: M20/M25/M40 family metallo-hydrolase [Gaiellaceae bacterium]|nr:M20/M25/M40 family metallo-hydrolase [Gaiellaceae bacterium]
MPEVVELLRELIRFDTTNPPGDEAACVAHVRSLVEEAGVETRVVARDDRRPNLLARVRGAGEAPPLLLYGHVDVVTTAGQRWTRDPFGGELVDGVVWGRGALDMKGGVAMLVDAFLRAARGELRPRGDLILCVLSDEENGGELGAGHLVEEHAGEFEGVRHAIGEFGGFSQQVAGRRIYPIQVAEKQICRLRAVVRGPGGHGSLPQRGGTMGRLARFLRDLEGCHTPVHVTPVARSFVEGLASVAPAPQRALLRGLLRPALADRVLALLPEEQGRTFAPILRNTASPTIVRGGDTINVVPSEVELELDGRLLPGFRPDDLIRELHALAGADVEVELVRHDPGPPEPDLAWLDGLGSILRELDPEGVPVPLLMPGVTDGRFFAKLGIQTYGFLPLRLPGDFKLFSMIHAADERVPADAIRFGAEAVGRAVERYAA